MKRVQVQFSDAQSRALQELASASERPVAAVVREAVDAWMTDQKNRMQVENATAAIGGFHSGLGDLAEDHDRYLNAGDLVSISEISRRAGRSTNTIQSWRRRYQGFPKPMTQLAAGPIWDWDAVAKWISRRSAGRGHQLQSAEDIATTARLPGFELVSRGMADLHAGRESVEGILLRSASTRLEAVGIKVPGGPVDDATTRLYRLVVAQVGEARAHSRYNALRRRLSSFLHAAEPTNAQTT